MAKEKIKVVNRDGAAGFVFFLAWFGALFYFMDKAHGFWEVILAFLQACVWPAILLYHVLGVLHV